MARDVDLFSAVMSDVAPLKGRRTRRAIARAKPDPAPVRRETAIAPVPATTVPPIASQPFDRDIDRALGRGRRLPQATLDLHGMTLAAAERAVGRFLAQAVHEDLRLVLVVTGKGWRQQDGRIIEGRIRAELPGWLERADNRALVRGLKAAHPRHGGSGAFYVLLRRRSAASSRSLRATPQR